MGLLTVKNSSSNPGRRRHQSSRTEFEVTTFTMSHHSNGGGPEINNNKAVQQTKKPKTSLINKLFKRKKPSKATVTSSSSTESESEDQNKHLRFFSKRKSKRKSTGVKNVTEKFDHVVISPERKIQTVSANTSPYQIRQIKTRLEYEHENNISSDNANQTQEHLYINTTDIQPWPTQHKGRVQNQSRQDVLRGIANEQEYLRRLKISSQGSHNMKSNDITSGDNRNNSGRGTRKDLLLNDSTNYKSASGTNQRNMTSQQPYHVLKSVNNRMHYRSDDNISRTYENSSMFDHLNGNLSSPSARRSHKHLSDDDNISLRRRNSKNEVSSSSENVNSNSLSRRSRAARNERYYKRLSRDHEMEKLVLPLSPKNKHKVQQQTNSMQIVSPNTKINYAPRYPNFQKISQPYYNLNSTYPLPQSVGNSSRVSSSSSLNRTVIPYPLRSAAVNRSRLSSSSTSSYPHNSTYPPQQNMNLSRISLSSTLSQANSSNYPTPASTDMRLVHAIPFKSVSYDSNINNNVPQPADTRDMKSMSFDNINQSQVRGARKIPPCPPPRNPNRKTIAIYEAPGSIVQSNQKRHSSHQHYESNVGSNKLDRSDGSISRIPYNEAYTGERAYLIKQAHPNNIIYTSNPSENFIANERSQYNVHPIHPEELLQQIPNVSQSDQTYFHHKNNAQISNDHFHPDSRYTNNDRLNEPNQYNPSTENKNVQFYSATSKIITSNPQSTLAQVGYENGDQLYENGPAIRAHNSSQHSKRPSSISPSDSQCNKRSFTDQHFPDPQILMRTQRLTRSNETLPHDENFIRMNEIGIPVYDGSVTNFRQVKVPSVKRPSKVRQSLEVKETMRPLSIVLEKSENELDSDRINNTVTTRSFSSSRENTSTKNKKLNENGLRITRDGKSLMGSASNLDDALTELEQIYESLNLNDEDLLDRAERRDLPICYQISKDQARVTPEVEEINRILGNSNNPNRNPSTRRIAIANKINDDMAIRKFRYQKDNTVNPNFGSETGSYLLTSPTFSPPPFFEDKPASPVTFVDVEPDVTRDDVVYRNTKYVNNLLKVHEPQPFGIPLRPVINSSSTDYLHATPDSEKYRSTFHSSKTPDVVMDDLAYRNLRKDYNKDCNTLTNFNIIPALVSERNRNSSPLPDKHIYLSNLNDEERLQKKKKRAVRSLSGNLFMRDYHTNDSDRTTDFLRLNGQSNFVRSETTSPENYIKKYPILENEFEKLKERWLSTPSPEDMKRQSNRDKSLLCYMKENSISSKKIDEINTSQADTSTQNPCQDINISSEVESLRKKFVTPDTNKKQRTDKSNPFKKMLNEDFDISPEIESIRKKFVTNKGKSEKKNNLKSVQLPEKSLHESEYKKNFKVIKTHFDSSESKTNEETNIKNKSPNSGRKKSESKKSPKKINTTKDNPYVSKFENIRNLFSEKNDVEEVKEIIKPKKKIKKFRETNNNSFATTSDYYDFKTNMDRNIDSLKRRLSQSDDPNISKTEDDQEDSSVSDASVSVNQEEKTENVENINSNEAFSEQRYKKETNNMSKEDELLQQLAKETTQTSEQINEKLKQLSTTVSQHKTIKLNQFPITLDDNVLENNNEKPDTERKIEKQSILKSAQTVSMESEYDNIPKWTNAADQHQDDSNLEEAPNFDDLNIPQDTNVYEGLDFNNIVKVGKIVDQFEKGNMQKKLSSEVNDKPERIQMRNLYDGYTKQVSISSEYDNVSSSKYDSQNQISADVTSVNIRKKEILLKSLDENKFASNHDNEPFVSLTMKNIPSEDVESTATSDNDVAISEISDEGINSQELNLINSYFQNGKTVNTVGIKISEIKNLNFESDSSFNSEVQNIFNTNIKGTIDDDCTDSEIDNLPIDMQIEILENKSISSLDNDSANEDFHGNFVLSNDKKDKYSLELEKTLDNGVNSETTSDSLKTLCHSPVNEVPLADKSEEVEESVESKISATNEISRQIDTIETNNGHSEHPTLSEQPSTTHDLHNENIIPVDPVSEKLTNEEVSNTKSSKLKESNNNDSPVMEACSNLASKEVSGIKLLRSKSSGNVPHSNGIAKSSPQSEKPLTDSPTVQRKPSNGFGKCCSSSSSSNLDLCSSETSSKSSNPCREVTPVHRRRSLPESPVKTLSLTNMCASLTRPEGVK